MAVDTWKIIDDNSTIHSGNQYQMEKAFIYMTNDIEALQEIFPNERKDVLQTNVNFWNTDWEGDLELVEVHEIYR